MSLVGVGLVSTDCYFVERMDLQGLNWTRSVGSDPYTAPTTVTSVNNDEGVLLYNIIL